jgi:hypothetical protein
MRPGPAGRGEVGGVARHPPAQDEVPVAHDERRGALGPDGRGGPEDVVHAAAALEANAAAAAAG